jgi:putative hydrolase of the HAD superfamily
LWLLSNHRSEWLLPRLKRFGLLSQFERILVSDELGKAKPDESIFRELRNEIADRSVLFIDDRQRNVDAAIAAGINAMQAVPSGSWLSGVNSWLEDSIVS